MKVFMAALTGLALLATLAFADEKPAAKPKASIELKDVKQRVSYSIGLNIGENLKTKGLEVDPEILAAGIKDALAGKPQLSAEDVRGVLLEYQRAGLEKVKKEGEAFLAANMKKPGVVALPSGLQYQVLKAGTGKSPKATDTVTVNYEGTLVDGTVFDSSYKRGEPATFPVNGVIRGWTEALQLMKVGAKWKLFIPSDLAYGATPRAGGPIRPNDMLIFVVELLDVK